MALTSQQFAGELTTMVATRRAFWEHPWIQKFRRAELSKEQVAEVLGRLHEAGVDGVLLTFRHVMEELEEFIEKVVPRLEQLGVRQSRRTGRYEAQR